MSDWICEECGYAKSSNACKCERSSWEDVTPCQNMVAVVFKIGGMNLTPGYKYRLKRRKISEPMPELVNGDLLTLSFDVDGREYRFIGMDGETPVCTLNLSAEYSLVSPSRITAIKRPSEGNRIIWRK